MPFVCKFWLVGGEETLAQEEHQRDGASGNPRPSFPHGPLAVGRGSAQSALVCPMALWVLCTSPILLPRVKWGCQSCRLRFSLNLIHQQILEWGVPKLPSVKRKRFLFHVYPSLADQRTLRARTQNKIGSTGGKSKRKAFFVIHFYSYALWSQIIF